jgi:hypothetical protein
MTIGTHQLFIYAPSPPTSLGHFVEFWASRYRWPNDDLYTQNIAGLRTAEALGQLFKWKIGNKLFASKLPLVEKCFINRSAEAEALVQQLAPCPPREAARSFLDQFKDGGAIYRIFWLHCWDARFPIYDQHVHRAMTFIRDAGRNEELGKFSHEKKVQLYLDRYLSFFDEFCGLDRRRVDQALWRFGKSLQDGSLPPLRSPS